jgi:predicted RNA-binding Zn ribbon-like protein
VNATVARVTGETLVDAPQPGGRRPAPGRLALVQAFVNTHYDLAADGGGELLGDPKALGDWMSAHALIAPDARLDAHDLARALAVREGLRALAFANNDEPLDEGAVEALGAASAGAATEIRIAPEGPRFVPSSETALDAGLAALLAITATAMIDGSWPRLKACPGRHCGWAFYDHSRNQSARWCSMQICGDREKARAYYRRRSEHPA